MNNKITEDSKPQLVQKNKIHSVLTALPLLMFMIGVGYYYYGEKKQSSGALVISEAQRYDAFVEGLSVIKSVTGQSGKHYFWFEIDGQKRGARISEANSLALKDLAKGEAIEVRLAPTIPGSKTMWAYQVVREGVALLPVLDNAAGVVTTDK